MRFYFILTYRKCAILTKYANVMIVPSQSPNCTNGNYGNFVHENASISEQVFKLNRLTRSITHGSKVVYEMSASFESSLKKVQHHEKINAVTIYHRCNGKILLSELIKIAYSPINSYSVYLFMTVCIEVKPVTLHPTFTAHGSTFC
jgi:hypothetical protein